MRLVHDSVIKIFDLENATSTFQLNTPSPSSTGLTGSWCLYYAFKHKGFLASCHHQVDDFS